MSAPRNKELAMVAMNMIGILHGNNSNLAMFNCIYRIIYHANVLTSVVIISIYLRLFTNVYDDDEVFNILYTTDSLKMFEIN